MQAVLRQSLRANSALLVRPASTATTASSSALPIANIEAQWKHMAAEDQIDVHRQLEVLQKKDWKELSLAEKRAAYYVAFGPHGPRQPEPEGTSMKVTFGALTLIAAGAAVFYGIRSNAAPPPKTITAEWREAFEQRQMAETIDPITGKGSPEYIAAHKH